MHFLGPTSISAINTVNKVIIIFIIVIIISFSSQRKALHGFLVEYFTFFSQSTVTE